MTNSLHLAGPHLDILDLRHFSAAQLRPLLRDEASRWERRLRWDYTAASNVLLEYLEGRVLPGFVALDAAHGKQIAGYTFCVFEAAKAVVGDVYAFHEAEAVSNPVCEQLLVHLLEMLQATPGVDRIESQLLMFPAGAFAAIFRDHRFRSYARLFMTRELSRQTAGPLFDARVPALPSGHIIQSWQPGFYDAAAVLIHRCYANHTDSQINDQYQTIAGAQRFLHNVIRFPGCGTFDPDGSFVLRDRRTLALQGLVLCSRIRQNVAHITQLCVAPELHGQGLGNVLLQHTEEDLRRRGFTSLSLTVTESNETALHLYRKHGFATLHRFEAMVWEKRYSTW